MDTEHSGESRVIGLEMKWVLGAVLAAIVIAGGVGLIYMSHERAQLTELGATNQTLRSSLAEMKSELQSMNEKLNEQGAATARAEVAARAALSASESATPVGQRAQSEPARPRIASPSPTVRSRPAVDPRFNQIQSRLEEQQKAIANNRDDLNKTRDDLQGKLDSTRDQLSGTINNTHDELTGSIARTHEEIVALQNAGNGTTSNLRSTSRMNFAAWARSVCPCERSTPNGRPTIWRCSWTTTSSRRKA